MRFSKYFLTFILLACIAMADAQQSNVLTMQQCVTIAIGTNLTVKQDSLQAEQNRIAVLQAKGNIIPNITAGANRDLTSGRALNPVTNAYITQSVTSDNYSVGGSVTVFNGLALENAVKQASLAYQSGKMNFQAAKDAVTINVIVAYLQVLDGQDILRQDSSQFAVAKENLDRSEILEKAGDNKFASDLYDFRGSYQNAKVNIETAQNSLTAARLSLYQLMNVPYDNTTTLQPLNAQDLKGNIDVNPNDVYNTGLSQLAVIKSATLQRQSAEKGVKSAKGFLYPQLYLSGGASTNYSNLNSGSYADQFRNNYGTYLQFGINIPIITNFTRRNNVALAKITLQNDQFIENNAKVQLKQQVDQNYYSMNAAYQRFQSLQDEVKAYTESFRISKIRYEAGVLTSVDFVTSKNNLDAANLALISAHYDYFIYSKILDYYQGKLLQ